MPSLIFGFVGVMLLIGFVNNQTCALLTKMFLNNEYVHFPILKTVLKVLKTKHPEIQDCRRFSWQCSHL